MTERSNVVDVTFYSVWSTTKRILLATGAGVAMLLVVLYILTYYYIAQTAHNRSHRYPLSPDVRYINGEIIIVMDTVGNTQDLNQIIQKYGGTIVVYDHYNTRAVIRVRFEGRYSSVESLQGISDEIKANVTGIQHASPHAVPLY